jgi:hypothetical protein
LQYGFRSDQYLREKDRIYADYSNDGFTLGHPANRVGFSNHDIMSNWHAQANWTHTFGATLLNEVGFAANSVGGANGQGGTDNVPEINVTGQSLGFTSFWGPGEYRAHNYNWREVLTTSLTANRSAQLIRSRGRQVSSCSMGRRSVGIVRTG